MLLCEKVLSLLLMFKPVTVFLSLLSSSALALDAEGFRPPTMMSNWAALGVPSGWDACVTRVGDTETVNVFPSCGGKVLGVRNGVRIQEVYERG